MAETDRPEQLLPEQKSIVFFDGHCVLCNSSVDFLLMLDKKESLLFAPLQGKTATRLLPAKLTDAVDTIILWHKGRIFIKSEAILKIAHICGGPWRYLYLFKPLPRKFRDALYDFIARRRYRWFGKKESCRLPDPKEQHRFLD